MLIGNKIQYNWKYAGTKMTGDNYIGNKIINKRKVLILQPHKVGLNPSPIEKWHINNH
jgi:hypothetical protein